MTEDKVDFVKFSTKPRDNRLYALDSTGVVWFSAGNDEWESIEDTPRHIKQGLTAGQLMQLMQRRGTQVI